MRSLRLLFFIAFLLPASLALAQQSGKIAGTVTDARTGEPLPGVNVIIEGTTTGATTDLDGYYNILNVSPGTYSVRASFVGYTASVQTGVRVQIDLTTALDFKLQEETVGLEELVVTAEAPIIQRDISGAQQNISAEEVTSGRYQNVNNVVTAQVGVDATSMYNDRPGIRGSGIEESLFIVDGVNQGDPLTNRPTYRVNMDAIQEIKMQTGGFSAEYGNLRSGVVTVVTKEGGETYSGSIDYRYSSPALKHDGPMMFGFDSPLVQPFLWPRRPDGSLAAENELQYDRWGAIDGFQHNADGSFMLDRFGNKIKNPILDGGWVGVAKDKGKAGVHLGRPMANYAKWLWQHRSPEAIQELKYLSANGVIPVEWGKGVDPGKMDFFDYGVRPDFNVSMTFGGPVPLMNRLKFFVTYDVQQTEYAYRNPQPVYKEWNFRGKVTTNVSKGTKLMLHSMYNKQRGGDTGQGASATGWVSANPFTVGDDVNKIWYPHCSVPGEQVRQIYGAQLTHTASANTFYQLDLTYSSTDYAMIQQYRNTLKLPSGFASSKNPPFLLDGAIMLDTLLKAQPVGSGWENWEDFAKIKIDGIWYDEAPYGYGPVNFRDATGEYRMESCNIRSNGSYTYSLAAKGSVTSQINRYNQIKAGFEVTQTKLDIDYSALDPSVNGGSMENGQGKPWNIGTYFTDKLEFQGFVANVGLRLDGIIHSPYPILDGTDIDDPNYRYNRYLMVGNTGRGDSIWANIPTRRVTQWRVSPRLGISHPISTVAKIFFNYGHMYQWMNGFDYYRMGFSLNAADRLTDIGNPMVRPMRTIQYEVGYEHNLFDKMHLTLSGYYKDVNDEYDQYQYTPLGMSSYSVRSNQRFRDIRGAEAMLRLNRGIIPFFSGWSSINYMVSSGGRFGYTQEFEDNTEQPRFTIPEISNPDVRPIWKANLDFFTPDDFGPSLAGFSLLGGMNLNLLYTWQRGHQMTWNPDGIPLIEDNVRWSDHKRWDLRFTKQLFNRGRISSSFYVDVQNLFNQLRLTPTGSHEASAKEGWAWDDHKWWKNQYDNYMRSLDLIVNDDNTVSGKDRPGDYPKNPLSYTYTPMTRYNDLEQLNTREPKDKQGNVVYDPNMIYHTRDDGRYFYMKKNDAGAWEAVDANPDEIKKILKDKSYIKMPSFTPYSFLEVRDIYFGIRVNF